jgi:hypothetical protein
MNLLNSLFASLTGTDLQAEATAAEQGIIYAVEIIIGLMIIMVVELAIIARKVS